MLQDAVKSLLEEFPLKSDVPGGMPEYRRSLVISFFFKFFWCVRSQLPGSYLHTSKFADASSNELADKWTLPRTWLGNHLASSDGDH